jgi:membrane-bound lytic murein transglycosylase D
MKTYGAKFAVHRPIRVSFRGTLDERALVFTTAFRIGRTPECEVWVRNDFVSRVHAEVTPESGGWRIRDLNSSNGLYLNGQRIETVLIDSAEVIRLGAEGPEISFDPQPEVTPSFPKSPGPMIEPSQGEDAIVAHYVDRYFRESKDGEAVGEHTMFVRRAFAKVETIIKEAQTRQRRIYFAMIAALLLASIVISVYAYHLRQEARRQRAVAQSLFYAMKSLDVEIAQAERQALESDSRHGEEVSNTYEARRKDMQKDYDQFLATLHVYDPNATEQHRLILRIARVFGECELEMPPDFEQEVLRYIKYWQSSGRFARDISLAKEKGYTQKIPQALLERGLPVQFFYLAMQESDFDPYISGPLTRKGIAKGMWQFIPETGVKYGLHLGPLVDLGRPDPADERDQADKATVAASRYLQMLYSTDAQASGLLVMACYNWGEDQVLPLVRTMPLNPRGRNFWRLLAEHRSQIPQQTYDYVFYITSAAVIGENPRLFGFNFDNPLGDNSGTGISNLPLPSMSVHPVTGFGEAVMQTAAGKRGRQLCQHKENPHLNSSLPLRIVRARY